MSRPGTKRGFLPKPDGPALGGPWAHGMCHTDEYHAWEGMKLRCSNAKLYPYHAGRSIKVCDRWANSFTAFYEDVGPRPSTEHSLDRYPDNNGNYEPGNVRWATRSEQQRNTRRCSLLTIGSVTRPMLEWDEVAGLRPGTVKTRVKRGWPIEEVLRPRNPIAIQRGLKRWANAT